MATQQRKILEHVTGDVCVGCHLEFWHRAIEINSLNKVISFVCFGYNFSY